MKNIYKLYIFFFTLLFSSCDYFYSYDFEIINETECEIVIKTSINPSHYGLYLPDSIYHIKQGEKVVFSEDAGNCNRNYIPEDSYILEDSIPPVSKFDIFIDGTPNKSLRLRSNWTYEAKKLQGTYTLRITPEILKKMK